ncbi:complex I subunit 4 family protein [Tengunoibacter tsumagoiensis]|uniref:Oxidoreductase n=1 Tax=Tengunoibacter tsumagoiensis TaxID=2014871 RepID=A0A401ZX52_9CHLR|nr:NADH-quinone oxidoreductase subunit M [Tengunoibacter tsumagoiensis]GCE11425.1 oxidoreductase [Tengunoibacter tsumagoiensis]
MIFQNLLTWIILLPVIGALVVYVLPTKWARWAALGASALTFAFTLVVFFIIQAKGTGFGDLQHLPYAVQANWINFNIGSTNLKIDYFLGVDGLSLPMVVLNGLLTMLAVIGGWEKKDVKNYLALLLFLEAGVMGVFMALDILFFFLFWEVELAPMFLLIGIWGSDAIKHGVPGRIYSAWKFLLYTFFGSVFMLAGFLFVYFTRHTGDMTMLSQTGNLLTGNATVLGITVSAQLLAFLLVFMAFAVKIPMFPFHTWLPDAHTDAPTEVSVLLAGVLLKMGAYGLIRFCLTLFPSGAHDFAGWLAVIAVINIIYGAAICLVQKDMKKLIAYSSVSHMGIILLGVAAAVGAGNGIFQGAGDQTFRDAALIGATLQMFSHGIITGLLFFCVGVIYDKAHTREIEVFGGVAKRMPMLGTLFTFAAMASLGLPGLAGFVAEYMVFTSSFRIWTIPTAVAVFTMILTAAYLLWMIKRVFFGPFNAKWNWLPDASPRELIPLFALAGLIVFVGVYPTPLIDVITSSLHPIVQAVASIK